MPNPLMEAIVAAGSAIEEQKDELMPEEGGEGNFHTEGLALAEEQVPEPQVVQPTAPKFCSQVGRTLGVGRPHLRGPGGRFPPCGWG